MQSVKTVGTVTHTHTYTFSGQKTKHEKCFIKYTKK